MGFHSSSVVPILARSVSEGHHPGVTAVRRRCLSSAPWFTLGLVWPRPLSSALVHGRELRPDQPEKVQPLWWPSSCPDDYARDWQAVQASVQAWLKAGAPAE